jgi:hypothetical protein
MTSPMPGADSESRPTQASLTRFAPLTIVNNLGSTSMGPKDTALNYDQLGLTTISFLKCLKCSKVPKMPKVNEIPISLRIDLAKGEHLNFSSL